MNYILLYFRFLVLEISYEMNPPKIVRSGVLSILAATVLIAGIFAFMPVEKTSTVHTSIGTQSVEVV